MERHNRNRSWRALVALTCLELMVGGLLFGCEADGWLWTPQRDGADAFYRIVSGDRAGFINRRGKIVIPPTLRIGANWYQGFYDGLLSLRLFQAPFINPRGQRLVGLDGVSIRGFFSEGVAAAAPNRDSKWGYVNHAGKFVVPAEFPPDAYGDSFSEGLAAVEIDGRVGYIDHAGAFEIPRQFLAGKPFAEGFARVVSNGPCMYGDPDQFNICDAMSPITAPRSEDKPGRLSWHPQCKWKFINKRGTVVSREFQGALGFHQGLAAVKIGGCWGFINTDFKMVIPPEFGSVHSFSDGLALVANDKIKGFIDKTGTLRIPADLEKTQSFSDGLTTMGDLDEGFVYVDTAGKQAFSQRFVLATRFLHGLAHVKVAGGATKAERTYGGGIFAYIDTKGATIFTYQVEDSPRR